MKSRRTASSGFTLLEVLAAVAILGIWYVILAGVAIQGLRAQGESQRRLEASFLADEAVANVEAGLGSGNAPDEGEEEYERGDYLVRVEIQPYSLELPPLADVAQSVPDPGFASVGVTDLLAGSEVTGESPLRAVHVEVSWPEGNDERSVVRDTFAFDLESVRAELAALDEQTLDPSSQDPEDQSGAGSVGGSTADDPSSPPEQTQ